MMGRLSGAQVQLFYAFRLEDRVPASHLLRQIDAVLDLGDLHRLLAPFLQSYRPPIDRPGTDDADAHHRLLLRYQVGAAALRRGLAEPCVPLVSLGGHHLSTPFLFSSVGNMAPDEFMLLCVLGGMTPADRMG